MSSNTLKSYEFAKEKYVKFGVDTDKVISILSKIPISLNCWQGDDLSGFEREASSLGGGGILVTGNYPGKPRNIDEFRKDTEKAFSFDPWQEKICS